MILGLIIAWQGGKRIPKILDKLSLIFAYTLIIAGIIYSVYIHGGITTLDQILETGVMAGFLGGTYLLAKNSRNGWLLFMIMNISMGLLMYLQESFILAGQQLVSLLFVIYGYYQAGQSKKEEALRI